MAHEESNRNTLQNNLPVEEIEVDIENMMERDSQEEQLVNQPIQQEPIEQEPIAQQPLEQQPIVQQEDNNNR